MAADVSRVLHDAISDPTFDSSRTGTTEYRVPCGCGHQSWGATALEAEGQHRQHRLERAEQVEAWEQALAAAMEPEVDG